MYQWLPIGISSLTELSRLLLFQLSTLTLLGYLPRFTTYVGFLAVGLLAGRVAFQSGLCTGHILHLEALCFLLCLFPLLPLLFNHPVMSNFGTLWTVAPGISLFTNFKSFVWPLCLSWDTTSNHLIFVVALSTPSIFPHHGSFQDASSHQPKYELASHRTFQNIRVISCDDC